MEQIPAVSPARVRGRVDRGNTVFLLKKKKKAPLIFIQNSRRAEGGNLACQQLSQGSKSLPEFGGKPQLGVNGTVNELMLAAGGRGGSPTQRDVCAQSPARHTGSSSRHGCRKPQPCEPCAWGGVNLPFQSYLALWVVETLGYVSLFWGRGSQTVEHMCSQCGCVIFLLWASAA